MPRSNSLTPAGPQRKKSIFSASVCIYTFAKSYLTVHMFFFCIILQPLKLCENIFKAPVPHFTNILIFCCPRATNEMLMRQFETNAVIKIHYAELEQGERA